MDQPITITGLGVLSPLGIGAEETVAALREGDPAWKPCGFLSGTQESGKNCEPLEFTRLPDSASDTSGQKGLDRFWR